MILAIRRWLGLEKPEPIIIKKMTKKESLEIQRLLRKSKSSSHRPENFSDYIGQKNAKKILFNFIKGASRRKTALPHVLIHGGAGMGKTTLANIIAKELNVKFVELLGDSDPELLIDTIQNLEGGILFIDEIHALDTETAEKLYHLMEDFKYNGQKVTPFTLIGATTELGDLIKRVRPFYDRFKIIIELENYSSEELIQLGRGYLDRVYFDDRVLYTQLRSLVLNSRGVPRLLIRLIDTFINFDKNIKEVLNSYKILGGGYTEKDLKVLRYISSSKTGVGLQGLMSFLGSSSDNYLYEIEPFLIQKEAIIRTARGRMITDKGLSTIKKLEKKLGG